MHPIELPEYEEEAPTVVASSMHVHRLSSTPPRPPEPALRPAPRAPTVPHRRDRTLAVGAGLALGFALGLLFFVLAG